jgi:tetratricopeptide (TPR) repeat protein
MNFTLALIVAAMLDLESIWNWDNPAESEKKFRALPADGEVQTQIARAQGLQRKFDEAHKTLDAIVTNSPRIEVRYLLERGRVFNSSGRPDQARPLFLAAWERAQKANLDGFAVDAAHMLGILDGLEWNQKALALAEKSSDPKAQGWIGSLLNNIGWAYYDKGEYAKALDCFERDRKWFENRQKDEPVRIARYSIGKTLRALGRTEEALALQQKLKPDGYVLEEIAECLLALKRSAEARPYFAHAFELLSKDEWLVANEPQRLARLKQLAQEQPRDDRK